MFANLLATITCQLGNLKETFRQSLGKHATTSLHLYCLLQQELQKPECYILESFRGLPKVDF